MKIKFNKIGGQVAEKIIWCDDCVFNNSMYCGKIQYNYFLNLLCKCNGFLESSLDIFEL